MDMENDDLGPLISLALNKSRAWGQGGMRGDVSAARAMVFPQLRGPHGIRSMDACKLFSQQSCDAANTIKRYGQCISTLSSAVSKSSAGCHSPRLPEMSENRPGYPTASDMSRRPVGSIL